MVTNWTACKVTTGTSKNEHSINNTVMSVITLTIQVHERGSIREFQIYDPISRYIGCEFKTDDTDLTL